ncbi:MAG: hypothetical protein Q8937_17670 [Bacteroidota bacterium]|nr:hypothetical protein [Bacteroidota bacterium]
MRSLILAIVLLHLCLSCIAQTKDSLLVRISRMKTKDTKLLLYQVYMLNVSETPICILHSAYISLFDNPPQRLAVFKKDTNTELFSLLYTARDTMNDYENTNDNYEGEPILPRQVIEFRILMPNQMAKKKYIQFDYMYLPDFCYKSFEEEMFKNLTLWHKKYAKLIIKTILPSNYHNPN